MPRLSVVKVVSEREEGPGVVQKSSLVTPGGIFMRLEGDVDELKEEVGVLLSTSLTTPLVVGAQTVPTAEPLTWTLVGSVVMGAALYSSVVWSVTFLTGDALNAVEARLFNKTDNLTVETLSSTDTQPDTQSVQVSLDAGKVYEVQLRSGSASPLTGAVILRSALEFTP